MTGHNKVLQTAQKTRVAAGTFAPVTARVAVGCALFSGDGLPLA